MKLSHRQAGKRRWREQRAERAKRARSDRAEYRRTAVRIKTPFGIVHLKSHPIFWEGRSDAQQPGFYGLTK